MSHTRMLVNYTPGEECRIAVTTDGSLEEFNAERFDAISRVGNIYVGKVQNIEPAIQAAFVDFGVPDHGFLHITDLHPRYFPGEDDETTERVGKKTPRRSRPPIQQCLKRGQRIIVQVLKEGVGTKGPTLTSYLSIPGRYLVMMPQMDRVGVSRKVEDEDQRRKMREILDQLDLPEGLGFILRTAGMDRTKAELKRDLAYLQRLWKDMQKRQSQGKAPRLLYSESDLLVRTLRDSLNTDVKEIVVDDEQALERVSKFLRIVAPRSRPPLVHHDSATPLFHAFGVETQIAHMKAREVPLPSGGRLVFDETEALVAIDVNSGKSRSARDAETNAYKTNLEAADEICRQLRLRDMGGLVICDLIDMRDAKHRRALESRFRERLKRDRARSTTLPISGFGILEMTRQRMRASHESMHFTECPSCHGRGVVQKPTSVADDAIRSLAALLAHERVSKVEMVVSPRVASELLSGRRKSLTRLELQTGRRVDVRVSETISPGAITLYAYDDAGADIEIDKLPAPRPPQTLKPWKEPEGDDEWAVDVKDEPDLILAESESHAHEPHPIELDADDEPTEDAPKKKRRRRRRGRKKKDGIETTQTDAQDQSDGEDQAQDEYEDEPQTADESRPEPSPEPAGDEDKPKKKRRRRRKKKSTLASDQPAEEAKVDAEPEPESDASETIAPAPSDQPPSAKKRRRRRSKSARAEAPSETEHSEPEQPEAAEPEQPRPDDSHSDDASTEDGQRKKRRRRRRKKPSGAEAGTADTRPDSAAPKVGPARNDGAVRNDSAPRPEPKEKPQTEVKPAKRFLYAAGRRKLAPSERSKGPE